MSNISFLNTTVSQKVLKANVLNLLSNMQGITHPLETLTKKVDFSLHYNNLLEIEHTLKSKETNPYIQRIKDLPRERLLSVINEFKKDFYEYSKNKKTA